MEPMSHDPDCWPGLDERRGLSIEKFLELQAKYGTAERQPAVTVDQIIQILKLASLIFGFSGDAIVRAASQIHATLSSGR